MKTLKKHWKWAIVAAIVVLLAAIFATWRPVKYPATQAYVVGRQQLPGPGGHGHSSWERAMPLSSPRMKTAGRPPAARPRPRSRPEFVTRFIDIYENASALTRLSLPQPDCIDYETARTRRILGFGKK